MRYGVGHGIAPQQRGSSRQFGSRQPVSQISCGGASPCALALVEPTPHMSGIYSGIACTAALVLVCHMQPAHRLLAELAFRNCQVMMQIFCTKTTKAAASLGWH